MSKLQYRHLISATGPLCLQSANECNVQSRQRKDPVTRGNCDLVQYLFPFSAFSQCLKAEHSSLLWSCAGSGCHKGLLPQQLHHAEILQR